MSTTTQRPTPETDTAWASWPYAGPGVHANFARKLERERDEARAIVSACMSVMPVGNIQTHTPENLAARIGDLASALAAETSENEAMREAIRVAHEVIEDADGSSYHIRGDAYLTREASEKRKAALAKLQPFLKP